MTLLEEPLAALYAWIAAHRRRLAEIFAEGALILVCDVGGGTTDFSLIQARIEEGELAFERIAIGEHLLLGGDNLDLALASLVEQKLASSGRLTLTQRQVLRRKCTAAKESLLADTGADRVTITLLGSGRGVVGGGLTTELTREEVVSTLVEGFLPVTAPSDLPARDRRVGLRELGLPFEAEPAITRHLAGFLTRAGAANGSGMMRPDAVLFNGGFFTPARARDQVLDVLAGWFGDAAAGARERGPRVGGGDRRGVLRQAPPGSGGLEAPADSGGQRQVVLHRRRCRARHAGRAVRDAARNGGGHPLRSGSRAHRGQQSAGGVHAV